MRREGFSKCSSVLMGKLYAGISGKKKSLHILYLHDVKKMVSALVRKW
ncbi:hypothetical protein RUMHYD_02892 [Blautia hydrogenotrophica DSM 10507]|uniref:Uncharacterized protein n=1 Tax=Blautia hydrogenotrophica (strain DSM 10507 / JCM 14656 / S5a33) TaxID=476272 RepID=C0CPU1_BLAHS|nr:hypothetical protein RUMHYD_02892 [Blautia hydrogenotrophica DSM 10507]